MLAVTEAAGTRRAQMIGQRGFREEIAIRLLYQDSGIGMQPDSARPGAATIEHVGQVALLLNEQTAQLLTNDTLDLEGAQRTLTPGEEPGWRSCRQHGRARRRRDLKAAVRLSQ